MRRPGGSLCAAAALLCLLGCGARGAAAKSAQPDSAAREVTLKVHVSDASTHQPVTGATIEVFTNQTSFSSEVSGADGNAFVKFSYQMGTLLIVTATKHGYVPNSAPWRPARLPVFSSLSLDLLPERSATLMVYEDIVQIVSGFQGSRVQPRVQFQRRTLALPPNTTYSNLTAHLTTGTSAWELDLFPYLQGLGGNGTGAWLKSSLGFVQKEEDQLTLTYIAPQLGYWVAAMSPLNTGPVVAKDISTYHTVFLLTILGGMAVILLILLCLLLYYCRRKCIKPRAHHRKLTLGSALESSTRDQATSMSHLHLISEAHLEMVSCGEADLHTPMLRPSYTAASRDFGSRQELLSEHGDPGRNRGSLNNLASRAALLEDYQKSVETFPLKAISSGEPSEGYESPARADCGRSYSSMASQPLLDKRGPPAQGRAVSGHLSPDRQSTEPLRTPDSPCSPERDALGDRRRVEAEYLMSRSVDHLERPTTFPRPGRLTCCSSVDQVSDGAYRRVLPTLVIPAHYMRLPGEHPYAGQALLLQTEEQSELETIQAELSASQPPGQPPPCRSSEHLQLSSQDLSQRGRGAVVPESLSIPGSLSEAGLVQMNGEDQLLAEKTLLELRGGKPLPHPRAWFVSLDGRSNAHIRHSYIDLQRAGRGAGGSQDASLDSGVDMHEPRLAHRMRERRARSHTPAPTPAVPYTQLVFVDDLEDGAEQSSPEDSGPLLDQPPDVEEEEEDEGEGEQLREDGGEEEAPSLGPLPETRLPTEPPPPTSPPTPPDDAPCLDEGPDDQDEKKSPWQKREERPLLALNLK
ncbi:protein FAM171A1 isoform X2 [Amia ocellicauda]|uniref:protein FAM171A1 isoform X2 n=1 Tax=Amia ocellicauda TaxID=2972642 RepID=UPI003464435D